MADFTDQQKPLAAIPKQLLEDLNQRFPPRCPEMDWTDRQIWFYAGQRAVVEFLNAAFQRQVETRFDNVINSTK